MSFNTRAYNYYQTKYKDYTNYKEELRTIPKSKALLIQRCASFFGIALGVNIWDKNYKPNLLTYFLGMIMLDYFVTTSYSWYYYWRQKNYVETLTVICIHGIVVPGVILFTVVMQEDKRKVYAYLANFGLDFLYPEIGNDKFGKIMTDRVNKQLFLTIKVLILMSAGGVLFIIIPMRSYFIDNELPLLVPTILPILDPESNMGKQINALHSAVIAIFGQIGIFVVEVIFSIIINNFWASADVMKYNLDLLLAWSDRQDEKAVFQRQRIIRRLDYQVHVINMYYLKFRQLFYLKYFIQPILCAFCIALSVFCYMAGTWSGGIGIAMYMYLQLLLVCYHGETITSSFAFMTENFFASNWEDFNAPERKGILILVRQVQTPFALKIGPLQPLNFEAASAISKTIFNSISVLFAIVPQT